MDDNNVKSLSSLMKRTVPNTRTLKCTKQLYRDCVDPRHVERGNLKRFLVPWQVLAVVCFAANLCAQSAPISAWPPAVIDNLHKLQQAALRDEYGYQRLAHLTDNIGPRVVGSPQAAAAVDYVANELRSLGLEVRVERVKVPRWVRGEESCELVQYPGQVSGTTQKIVVAALGAANVATPKGGITADVIVVRSFTELAALPDEKISGKVIVFNARLDRLMADSGFAFDAYDRAVEYRNNGRIAGGKRGAVAVLVRSVGGVDFRLLHVGATDYFNVASIPAAAITAEDADLIARLAAQGPVRLHLVLNSQMSTQVDSYNVIGDLRGSEYPEQVVIVSGHIDSWDLGTGAIDDAAGVSIAMATAHLIHQLKLRPTRTIRVVAWMGEEAGLLGARAYAKEHAGEMANHIAAIETDSGAGHAMGIYITGDRSLPGLIQPVADVLQESGAGILRNLEESAPDLIPLYFRGVPAFAPIQDTRKYFDYHHTPADTFDKIDPQELRENIAVVSVLAYALATTSQELPRQQLALPDWLK
jgi:carboxypeptidase Q